MKTPPLVRLGFIWEKSHLVSLYEYETVRLIIYLKSRSPLRIDNVARRPGFIYSTSLNDTSYFINFILGATDKASLKFLSSSKAIISPLTFLSPAK